MLFAIDNKKKYHINVLAAVNNLYAAWDAVKESTIAGCFKYAGFTQNQIEYSEKAYKNFQCEEAGFPDFYKTFDHENVSLAMEMYYVDVDNNLDVCGSLSNSDIVKEIHDAGNKDADAEDTSRNELLSRPTEQFIT